MNDQVKCQYCKEKIEKSYYRDHLNFEHGDQIRAALHRLKIALPLMLIGFSFVAGMIWMGFIN